MAPGRITCRLRAPQAAGRGALRSSSQGRAGGRALGAALGWLTAQGQGNKLRAGCGAGSRGQCQRISAHAEPLAAAAAASLGAAAASFFLIRPTFSRMATAGWGQGRGTTEGGTASTPISRGRWRRGAGTRAHSEGPRFVARAPAARASRTPRGCSAPAPTRGALQVERVHVDAGGAAVQQPLAHEGAQGDAVGLRGPGAGGRGAGCVGWLGDGRASWPDVAEEAGASNMAGQRAALNRGLQRKRAPSRQAAASAQAAAA